MNILDALKETGKATKPNSRKYAKISTELLNWYDKSSGFYSSTVEFGIILQDDWQPYPEPKCPACILKKRMLDSDLENLEYILDFLLERACTCKGD
jgi:hypothetical protein